MAQCTPFLNENITEVDKNMQEQLKQRAKIENDKDGKVYWRDL